MLAAVHLNEQSKSVKHKKIEANENKKDGYRQLNVLQLGSLRPWDHRSKCYMDRGPPLT